MHDSSTATLNKVDYQQEDYRRVDFLQVNYHQVEEKSGHIGVLSLNNHQVDYLQLDNYQLDYHRRDYHKVDYHQQKTMLTGRHLWLDCRKMICDKLLQQVLDLLVIGGLRAVCQPVIQLRHAPGLHLLHEVAGLIGQLLRRV